MVSLHLWWMRGSCKSVADPIPRPFAELPVLDLLETTLLLSLALAHLLFRKSWELCRCSRSACFRRCAALRVSVNLRMALLVAGISGAASGFLGYLAAFQYELPVGASQTLVGITLVLVAEVVRRFALRAS